MGNGSTGVTLLPFVVNVMGKNVFLELTVGGQIFVFNASQGLCHLAWTTEVPEANPIQEDWLHDIPEIGYKRWIHAGPVELFTENRLDPMRRFHFDFSRGDASYDYSALEFPWLLIPIASLGGFFLTGPQSKRTQQEGNANTPTRKDHA